MSGYVISDYTFRDGQMKTSDIVVPDGSWVVTSNSARGVGTTLPIPTRSHLAFYEVVGSQPEQVMERLTHTGESWWGNQPFYILIGSKPFGLIRLDWIDGNPTRGKYFQCARQVVDTKLGARPNLDKRPRFVGQSMRHPEDRILWDFQRAQDYRRGKNKWAKLTDLATLVGMNPGDLIEDFFQFTDWVNPGLNVWIAREASEIQGVAFRRQHWRVFDRESLPNLWQQDPDTIWVRQGFAMTVLYLHHFGYQPDRKVQPVVA